jgi:hypothetical protein
LNPKLILLHDCPVNGGISLSKDGIMAVNQVANVSYGLNQPLVVGAPTPIISQRVPTANDKAEIGTIWINTLTNSIYTLTSIVSNAAVWTSTAGGADVVASITATTGPNSLTGTTTINTTGAATTTIGTGGTGAVNIGNATGNTTVTGSLTATSLASTTAITAGTGLAVTTGNLVVSTGNITATAGSITSNGGNIIATVGDVRAGGSIDLLNAASSIAFQAGPLIIAGAGNPTGVVTAPQGSLFLSNNGSSTSTRAFINTNSGTGWTAITTAA